MFCYRCGASMPDTATVCPQCSAPVPQTSKPAATPATVGAPVTASPSNLPAQPYPVRSYAGEPQTDGKAVGSLVLGILSLVGLWLLAGIPAVILGHLSKSDIRKSMGRLKGDGMATAGLIMGYLSVAALPIVLIIAAIAIPSLLRSRMAANQSAAASTVRTISTAQITYSTDYPSAGYARDLATLGPGPSGACAGEASQEHACLIDGVLGNATCVAGSWCTKYGYKFAVTAVCEAQGACSDYVAVATPVNPGTTGTKSFCSTSDAIVRVQNHAYAGSPPSVAECQSWSPIE